MKFTKSTTEWVKFGDLNKVIFIGKVAVGYGKGCYMMFIDLETHKRQLYRANSRENGEGVRCYTGHQMLPLFAFAESCPNPNIYVYTYPEFNSICVLEGESLMGYVALEFADSSLLLSLDDLPNFEITIWNWRNSEKVTTINTNILTENQLLKTSLGRPSYLMQLEVGTTKATVWYMLMCSNRCIVTEQELDIPSDMTPLSSALWSAEEACFMLDVKGNVYLVNQEMGLDKIIEFQERGKQTTSFTWFKAGLFVAGPNLQIRHYQKNGLWEQVLAVEPPEPIEMITSNGKDFLVAVTVSGNILLYDDSNNTFEYISNNESRFDDFCLVYPIGKHIVTLAHNNQLSSWEVATGKLNDHVELVGHASALAGNPEYPYVAVGYSNGVLELFSLYKPDAIKSMVTFRLTRNEINSVYFTEISKLIVAADVNNGQFFIIEGVPGTKMNVVGTVDFKKQIADYILVASKTCYRLFTLPVTSEKSLIGNKFFRHCVIKGQEHSEVKEYILEDPAQMYTNLYATSKSNRDRVFYAVPFRSKMIHVIETKRADKNARVIQKISTGHQMNKVMLSLHKDILLSYAYDGLIMVRGSNVHEITDIIMPHHRKCGGILKGIATLGKKYILTLGRDNCLVCTSLNYVTVKDDQVNDDKLELMFKRRTTGFEESHLADMTWFELVAAKIKAKEHQVCMKERDDIFNEFRIIQEEVQELLTKNIEGPESEVLDIQKFNLDTEHAEQQKLWSTVRCKHTKLYLEELIAAQDTVSKWCRKYFWERMSVQGKSVWTINDNFDLQNYVLFKHECDSDELNVVEGKRKIEDLMARYDSFHPWIPYPESVLVEKLAQTPALAKLDEGFKFQMSLEEEEEEKESVVDFEQQFAQNGSIACNFVELNPWHYTQEERQSFYQRSMQSVLCLEEIKKLKAFFNNKFDNLHALKVREIFNIKERFSRLRHIISEINFFSIDKIDITIKDPEWKHDENPEMIITVKDNEVGITPYVSPEEQAVLDAKAAEEERIRLLLLADDFRERALMTMMNGVLEVRWEDELKKDVPVPKCMLEKDPENFVEEDLRAVRDYEEKVAFMQSERERYINILFSEYSKLSNLTREGMKKFNSRLTDSQVLKLEIETAILQQRLQVDRMNHINHSKRLKRRKLLIWKDNAKSNEQLIEKTQKIASTIYQYIQECKAALEQYNAKEKLLEKAFKKEYIEQSTAIQETTLKLYKRRPKINIRNITNSSVLVELAKCLTNYEKTHIADLNADSVEFLKNMEALDAYIGIPSIIDQKMFNNVCKLRRLKIENEIRVRAATIDVADGEQALITIRQRLAQKKALGTKLSEDIANIRQSRLQVEDDIEIQIAVRKALVEIPMTGCLTDFDDSILVCRKVVEDINNIIVKTGKSKLAAMRDTMAFRRKILILEWQHQELRMIIEDIEDQLKDIDNVKFTKEIQQFLESKAKNVAGDKGMAFEQEIDMLKETYERAIEEKKAAIRKMQKEITKIKKENKTLDAQIQDINVDICEFKLVKDDKLPKAEQYIMKERMATLIKRARLVKQIQENHNEILVKQTELELLRLKTYPTLKYKILA